MARARTGAQTEIARKRTTKPLDQRLAEAKATVAKLEAAKLAEKAGNVPGLARAINAFELVAPFVGEKLAEEVRHQLALVADGPPVSAASEDVAEG